MASVILATAGSALGSSLGFGAVGATLLSSVGGLVGGYVDQAVFGFGKTGTASNVQILDIPHVIDSGYGRTQPVIYGTARIAGNVIWMNTPKTTTLTQTQKVRTGKFSSKTVTTGSERYTEVDCAIALAAVPSLLAGNFRSAEAVEHDEISFQSRGALIGLRRIWANNELVYDARTHNLEVAKTNNYSLAAFYDGAESQQPDSHIETLAGMNNVPAFRGLGYVLLQNLRISDYGDRLPNFTFEVVGSLPKVSTQLAPEGLAEGLDGDVYVLSRLQRTITRMDPVNLKVKQVLGATSDYLGAYKAYPTRLAVSLDGHLWITCNGDALVQRIHPDTGAVLASIDAGHYPQDILRDASGKLWVTIPAKNQVQVIDPGSNAVVATYTVNEAPWALCLGHEGSIWVSCVDAVVRLNPANGAELARVAVGLFPWGLATNPVTHEIWVAVNGEDVLKIIDPATNAMVKVRNTGTYPTCVNAHSQDQYGSVAVTLLYGNQLKVYSRTYNQLLEYGTVAFPGQCLHRADGTVFITQRRYDFVLVAEGR